MLSSISVITLAYNEETTIDHVVRETARVVERLCQRHEIIVVDDGSTDATGRIAEEIAADLPQVRVVRHESNRGIGAGMITGLGQVRHDYVTYVAGDGQFPPAILEQFAASMAGADGVIGKYRSRPGGVGRRLLSFVWRKMLIRGMFGRFAMADGNYMFWRGLLDSIQLGTRTQACDIEFFYKAARLGFTFNEVYIDIIPRSEGRSKVVGPRNVIQVLREMLALRIRLAAER